MKNSPGKLLTNRISKICPSLSIFSCLTSRHMAAAVRSIQLKSGGRLRTFLLGALKQETFWNSSHIFFHLPFSFLFFVAHSLSDVWPRHPDIFNLHPAFYVSRIFSRPNVEKVNCHSFQRRKTFLSTVRSDEPLWSWKKETGHRAWNFSRSRGPPESIYNMLFLSEEWQDIQLYHGEKYSCFAIAITLRDALHCPFPHFNEDLHKTA